MSIIDLKERIAINDAFSPAERDFILAAVNAAADATDLSHAARHSPANYLGRIDRLWAFLSVDDGGEGLCAAPIGGMTLPLVGADKRRVDMLIPLAKKIAAASGKPVRLAKFGTREDVEIYQP
jgi:hypothetical protein